MKRNLFVAGLSLFALAVSLGFAHAATATLDVTPKSGAATLTVTWAFTVTLTDPQQSEWYYSEYAYINTQNNGNGSGGSRLFCGLPQGGTNTNLTTPLGQGIFSCTSKNYINPPTGPTFHIDCGPITVTVTAPLS